MTAEDLTIRFTVDDISLTADDPSAYHHFVLFEIWDCGDVSIPERGPKQVGSLQCLQTVFRQALADGEEPAVVCDTYDQDLHEFHYALSPNGIDFELLADVPDYILRVLRLDLSGIPNSVMPFLWRKVSNVLGSNGLLMVPDDATGMTILQLKDNEFIRVAGTGYLIRWGDNVMTIDTGPCGGK